jgi:DNA-binding transcriptional LysR family regulator
MKAIHALAGLRNRTIVPVDLRDLEYFLACCKAPSFSAAARDMSIVQSAMSHAIARLEQDLGATLFDRSGSRVTLTAQGAVLQKAAERLIAEAGAARDEVAAASGHIRGTVTLGSTLHTGRLQLAAVFSEIRECHPGVIVHLRQAQVGSIGMVQAVSDGSLDIALNANPGPAPKGIAFHPLLSEPMVFICKTDHRLSQRAQVAVPDLQQEMILRAPPGWGTRAIVDATLGATQSAFEVCSYALMASLVRAGFATTLTPESAISGDMLAGLCAVPVDDPRMRWVLSAAVCTDRRMSAATAVVLDALTRGSATRALELTPRAMVRRVGGAYP